MEEDDGVPHGSFKLEKVRLADLNVDPEYQRGFKKKWVAEMAEDFDADILGLDIRVNRRPDGSLWIIDGQQRVGILKARGFEYSWALVYNLPTKEDESRMFAALNLQRTRNTRAITTRALILGQDPETMAMIAFVASKGFTFSPSGGGKGEGNLYNCNTIWQLWHKDKELLGELLDVLRAGFTRVDTTALRSQVVKGLGYFLEEYFTCPQYSRKRLIKALSGTTGLALATKAAMLAIRNMAPGNGYYKERSVMTIVWELYNSRLKGNNRLPLPRAKLRKQQARVQ